MKRFMFLFAGLILIGLSSCNSKSECSYTELTPITSAIVPDTVSVNELLPVKLSFVVKNGCGSLAYINRIQQADTLYFGAYAYYEGCTCPAVADTLETEYNLMPNIPGKYYFKFYTSGDKYITDSIYISPSTDR